MLDMHNIGTDLRLRDDGIWYAPSVQDISYPSQGNSSCFAIEEGSFWFGHRNECIIAAVRQFPPPPNDTIYDIGGGNGYVAASLMQAGFSTALIEPGPIGASNAKKRGVPHVICGTTETAGIQKNVLPAVGLFDVIEHIEQDVEFLRSIRQVVRHDGLLYATVPAFRFLWSAEDDYAGHYRRYTLRTIGATLASAGFDVEYMTYIFRPLVLPIFLLRALPYKLGLARAEHAAKDVPADHMVRDSVVKRIVRSTLRGETHAIEQHYSMRLGASCLVVARAR